MVTNKSYYYVYHSTTITLTTVAVLLTVPVIALAYVEISEELIVVESIAHHKLVGNLKPSVCGIMREIKMCNQRIKINYYNVLQGKNLCK